MSTDFLLSISPGMIESQERSHLPWGSGLFGTAQTYGTEKSRVRETGREALGPRPGRAAPPAGLTFSTVGH